jgi:RNA polymerase sigma factor (sigma-70 family)
MSNIATEQTKQILGSVIAKLLPNLKRTLRSRFPSHNPDDIEDAMQDAIILYITRGPEHVRESTAMSFSWLFTVTFRSLSRLHRTRNISIQLVEPRIESHEEEVLSAIEIDEILEALTDAQRVVVAERHAGKSFEEVAQSTGVSITACKVRYTRAIRRLQKILGGGNFLGGRTHYQLSKQYAYFIKDKSAYVSIYENGRSGYQLV